MSSLSAQLASLNSSGGKNAGSSLSTSKRHSDAVGRGIAHSVTHGHSISSTSARHKPSVLYADSKAASDVPLTTLRENCVSSLRQLAKLTNNNAFCSPKFLHTLAGAHSVRFERGLATASENAKVDNIIAELLSLLSTTMGESASTSTTSCFSSSLHVLEYLLRRYDIHTRPTCMEHLLKSVLPHHEQPIFGRVLQLLDLASLQTYSFLRPHAATGAPSPNRTVLAKRAAKDDALIRVYCEMAKSAANIHALECHFTPFQRVRKGVSRVMSFAAAVLLEAMNIQATHRGSIAESTLRTLLPHVLSACGDNSVDNDYSLGMTCSDWRGFGQVMASCISEKCVLSNEARETLATSICKGALETERACMESHDGAVELVADCVATLMTVLSVSPKDASNSKLEMVPSRANKSFHDALGYALPVNTYQTLIQLKVLSKALGHLYSDRDLVVAPMVASLVAVTLSWPNKKHLEFDLICKLVSKYLVFLSPGTLVLINLRLVVFRFMTTNWNPCGRTETSILLRL